MDDKKLFVEEIKKIHNETWRNACLEMVDKIPNYFWVVPASSSGKYHPAFALGDGGLVRHSLMVCKIALDLLRGEVFVAENETNEDTIRIAALFHDCIKQGVKSNGHTAFEHPIEAMKFVRENLKDKVDSKWLSIIAGAINSHMGKWTTSNYSSYVLTKPQSEFEKLIHIADYIASRKYTTLADEFKEEQG